jgi:hypothetical protein
MVTGERGPITRDSVYGKGRLLGPMQNTHHAAPAYCTRTLLIACILAGLIGAEPRGAQADSSVGAAPIHASGAHMSAGQSPVHGSNEQTTIENARERDVGRFCDADPADKAVVAFEIGLSLLRSQSAEIGIAWIGKAAELGYSPAAWLLDRLPATGHRLDRCGRGETLSESTPFGIRDSLPYQEFKGRMPPRELKEIAYRIAASYGLDPALLLSVMSVESGFRADVVSVKRAMGLMQIIPETAARFGLQNPFQPEENIAAGSRYLRWLLDRFDGEVSLALAAYNAGEGAVDRYRGIPPYRETIEYVDKVKNRYAVFSRLLGAGDREQHARLQHPEFLRRQARSETVE